MAQAIVGGAVGAGGGRAVVVGRGRVGLLAWRWGWRRWGTGGEGLLANGEGRGRGSAIVAPQQGEICRPDATRLGLGLKEGEP